MNKQNERMTTNPLFRIEYEFECRVWSTVVESTDRDSAMTQFRRDNPHVQLRACEGEQQPEKCNACASLLKGQVVNHDKGLYPAYCILDAGHSGNHKTENVQWSDAEIGKRIRTSLPVMAAMTMEERS